MTELALTKLEHLHGDADSLKDLIVDHLRYSLAKDKYTATKRDVFHAVAATVMDHMVGRWIESQQQYYDADAKRVYYLSMEFLIGRTMQNSLVNLGILENCRKAVHDLGFDLDQLFEMESDAGLGNGGLGRLAACFLDSMATLGIPGYGYGMRYDYGIFTQKIVEGEQVETPDNWLRYGNPWEVCRSEYLYPVQFYGHVEPHVDARGKTHMKWVETQEVMAMAYDTPVPGYHNQTVNTMRLWQAKSSRGFDLSYFNHGDYIRAVEDIARSENISKVLYPNDNIFEGKELRLKQEYFLVSATLQDIIRRYNKGHIHLDELPNKVAIQLNDTHPALAIPEMMRLLVDREEISWDKAWQLTTNTLAYTNHTLLPEALERWSIELLQKVLPRHMQIIEEINKQWLSEHKDSPDLSIIEGDVVNMAKLAIVGAHKVNGVSALHSELLKTQVFKAFSDISPNKFTNKTNGITPRRWLKMCNPLLSDLITSRIGDGWATDLDKLKELTTFEHDPDFCARWTEIKHKNKENLAKLILAEHEVIVDPHSLFDCHIKRLHEYKRQLLNIMRVIHDYCELKENPSKPYTPRTVIFSGKAAPGYAIAKLIIRLITGVAKVVNNDPTLKDKLKVIFLENYRVSLAEKIIPATDLSEQISTAGTEASGTGNMKFALNGALTIGTLDGANIEILEEVGPDNIFIFGLKTDEVQKLKADGYDPKAYLDPNLTRVLDLIRAGKFGEKDLFAPLLSNLLDQGDYYCLLADFASYVKAQDEVSALYRDQPAWIKKSIHNVAKVGRFSSDRTIKDYAEEIWKL